MIAQGKASLRATPWVHVKKTAKPCKGVTADFSQHKYGKGV